MKDKPKNPHAVALGRLGGAAGTGEKKRTRGTFTSESAKKAAEARWAKQRKRD